MRVRRDSTVEGKGVVFDRGGRFEWAWLEFVREAKQKCGQGQHFEAGCSMIQIEPLRLGYRSQGYSGFHGVRAKIAHYGKTGNGLTRVV